MPRNNKPQNIVLIRTDRIGEVLLSTVAVDVIKKRFPNAKFTFITSGYSRPLLEDRKDIAEVLTFETMKKANPVFKAFQLTSMLRKRHFDIAVVFNPHKALHMACFLAGIPIRVGYDRKWGVFLNRKIEDERDKGEKHEIEYTMDLLRLLGIEETSASPSLPVSEVSEKELENITEKIGMEFNKPLIIIHPGSSNAVKIWPIERYVELIRRIKQKTTCYIVLIGSREEKDLSARMAFESGVKVINLTGALDLKQLAALLKRASLFIGNDSGPMHMAAALDVPVIAIFGRNIPGVSPTRWRPWGIKHIVFHEDSGCFPCYDAECPYEYKCIRAVTVDAVFEAVQKIMTEK